MNYNQAHVLLELGRLTKCEARAAFQKAHHEAEYARDAATRQHARQIAQSIWNKIGACPEALVPTYDRRVEQAALAVAVGALVELEVIVERRGDHKLGTELAAASRVVERLRARFAAESAAEPRQAAPAAAGSVTA